jgi:predicted amidophosphoribosyltransferase
LLRVFRFCAKRFCPRHAPTAIAIPPPFASSCRTFDPLARHDARFTHCRQATYSFDVARSAWIYDGAPRLAIHRFKYGGKAPSPRVLRPQWPTFCEVTKCSANTAPLTA